MQINQNQNNILQKQNLSESDDLKAEIFFNSSQTDSFNSNCQKYQLQNISNQINLLTNQQTFYGQKSFKETQHQQSQRLKNLRLKKVITNQNGDFKNQSNIGKQRLSSNIISDKMKMINDNQMKQSVQNFFFKF
ncbi:hypothetical protein ABPG73_010182, partial [Tetrahymena malaccensis]